jgi:hypothetical protein
MNLKIIISIGISLIFTSNQLRAQGNETVMLEYEPYRASSIFNQSGKVLFGVPVYKSSRSLFFISPEYKFFFTKSNELLSAEFLNQVSLRFVWQYQFEKSWKIQWLGVPVVTSPLSNKTGLILNNLLKIDKTHPILGYFIGIAYSQRYRNNIISPMAGFNWNPTNDWNLVGRVPLYLSLRHKLNTSLYMGVELSENNISSLSKNTDYDFVWLHERNLGLISDWKLYKKWWLSGMVGYSLNRSLTTYKLPSKSIWTIKTTLGEPGNEPLNQLHEKGFIVNIGVKYKLKN